MFYFVLYCGKMYFIKYGGEVMAKSKDDGSCGAFFILIAVLCAIEDWIKENYEKIYLVLGSIILIIIIIIIYAIYKHRKKKKIIYKVEKFPINPTISATPNEEKNIVETPKSNPESEISVPRKKFNADKYFVQAAEYTIKTGRPSIAMIQRKFSIGFNRAARIMDQLCEAGIVGPEKDIPRKLLMSMEQFESFLKHTEIIEVDQYNIPLSQTSSQSPDRIQMYNGKYDYMEGHDFEKFCAMLLEANGFDDIRVTQGSKDQGIDILARKLGVKYAIQCKCYSSDIGNKAVQEAFAGKQYYDCHVGVVLTNRYFTPAAKELAQKTQIFLWDRDALNILCENYYRENQIQSEENK